jgi:hypothetical protein
MQHFTLQTNPLNRSEPDDFVACCRPANRHNRKATWSLTSPQARRRSFAYNELLQRDKRSLDIFWLKDDSLRPPDLGTRRVEGRRSDLLADAGFGRSSSERTRLRGGKWKWYLVCSSSASLRYWHQCREES